MARTVGLLLVTLVLAGVLAAITMALFPGWPEIVQMAVPTELALAVVIAHAVRKSGRGWRTALALRPLDPRMIAPLVLILIGSLTVFSELYVVIQKLVPVPEEYEEMLRELMQLSGGADLVFTLLIAVLLAPALEEMLFRGVLLDGLTRRYGPRAACLWTAGFFALFHIYNPWQVLPTFFLGLVLAWLVLSTRSLVAAIFVHSLFNGLSLAVSSFVLDDQVALETPQPWFAAVIILILLAGSFALLLGLVWLEEQTGGGSFDRPRDSDGDERLNPPREQDADRYAPPPSIPARPTAARG